MVGTTPDDAYTTLDRKQIAAFAPNPQAIAAFESLQQAAFRNNPNAITGAQAAADQAAIDAAAAAASAAAAGSVAAAAQPGSAPLTGLSSLDAVVGLVEQVSTSGFTKRAIGVAAGTSIPTLADADARFVKQDVGAAWTAATGTASRATFATYAGQVVSNPPTQAQVQAIDDHVKILSQRLKGLIDDLQANGALT